MGGCIDLIASLGYRPNPGTAVDRDRGLSVVVLVADVHEQGVVVVLGALSGVRLLTQGTGPSTGSGQGGDERCPPATTSLRSRNWSARSISHTYHLDRRTESPQCVSIEDPLADTMATTDPASS